MDMNFLLKFKNQTIINKYFIKVYYVMAKYKLSHTFMLKIIVTKHNETSKT